MPALDFLASALADLQRSDRLRTLETRTNPPGPVVTLASGESLVSFSSNDYLGLAGDPRIIAAAQVALDHAGVGAGAARLLAGDHDLHHAVEVALAQLKQAEAALLFNSGYHANTSAIPALVGPEDHIISDALNHASLIDGVRLSRARLTVTPHSDLSAVEAALKQPSRRRLVVVESVFSMDGDLAPLAALRALCDAYGAILYVDEAHATGILGPTGAGGAEAAGIQPDVHMGTLGKALGTFGAFIAGSQALRSWLVNQARGFVFTTALPPALCAATLTALQIVRDEPERRATALGHARRFAAELGLPLPQSTIVPVIVGSEASALALSASLRQNGVLARAIRPPTVPLGTSRVRFAFTALHTEAHVTQAIAGVRQVGG